MFLATFVCGVASVRYLTTRRPAFDRIAAAAAELVILFGLIGLLTGPLWGRKAWGVWWQWDARLTSALILWMIFVAYALLRRFGGPGLGEAGRGSRALRHGERAVRLSLGEPVAHGASEDDRGSDARRRACGRRSTGRCSRSWRWGGVCCSRGCVSSVHRAALDEAYLLADEEAV